MSQICYASARWYLLPLAPRSNNIELGKPRIARSYELWTILKGMIDA